MTRPVHNHGLDPACRESLIGDCLRGDAGEREAEQREIARLVEYAADLERLVGQLTARIQHETAALRGARAEVQS